MRWYLDIITTPGPETAQTAVMVHLPKERYLFNCPEGLQRVCYENRHRMFKLNHLFLTRVDWASMGGLPGMLLTIGDQSSAVVNLGAGPNFSHFMAAMRSFINRPGFPVKITEFDDAGPQPVEPYVGEQLTVVPVLSYPASADSVIREEPTESTTEDDSTSDRATKRCRLAGSNSIPPSSSDRLAPINEIVRMMFNRDPNAAGRRYYPSLLPTSPRPAALTYICTGPSVPGKFDVKAAEALGVPKGRLRGQLVRGETIVLPDGTVISPDQCVHPGRPGAVFIVCDCPSVAYIDSLIKQPGFKPYYRDDSTHVTSDRSVDCLIHNTGPGVLQDPRYQAWMHRFGAETHHLVSGADVNDDAIVFTGSAEEQLVLSNLSSNVFHGPFQAVKPGSSSTTWAALQPQLPAKSCLLRPETRFEFEPTPVCHTENQIQPYNYQMQDRVSSISELIQPFQSKVAELREAQLIQSPKRDAKAADIAPDAFENLVISPLGTGSSHPSKYRNVSANLVKVPTRGNMLLDVGENTIGQLYRLLGDSARFNPIFQMGFDDLFADLHLIYISHMHADHHLGLPSILNHWFQRSQTQQGQARNLTVIGPQALLTWLTEYNMVQPLGLSDPNLHLVCTEALFPSGLNANAETRATLLAPLRTSLGITDVTVCRAIHCASSYCVALEHEQGWKLSYSGDTRPNPAFVSLGRDSDLLIHESTLEDAMQAEAIAKRHCTTSETLQVAADMNARYTLLTHFSQRYPRAPVFLNGGPMGPSAAIAAANLKLAIDSPRVGVAFDLMSVRMGDFPQLATFIPALKMLHPNIEGEAVEDVHIDLGI
ncbi:beta-lactamase-like protein [Dimargaris cristalligena]|uniref:ribonuclease Z n=1 Tax=Dimargaris cristalligena TaxID=215637 RepID=A0A4P9ZUX7_9FUNG|nr:beta-lactamase-like protein [Dimargaris cristalligena]|eukprot:RKP37384.1 beta-lactamase-like protein [Dimargaris cristalligena]